MNIFLAEEKKEVRDILLPLLDEKFPSSIVVEFSSFQQFIETLENRDEVVDLIICDYYSKGLALLNCLVTVGKEVPCVMISDKKEKVSESLRVRTGPTESIGRENISEEFLKSIEAIIKKGYFKDFKTLDIDFIKISAQLLLDKSLIESDVFIRLGHNKFCKLFKEGDSFTSEDLEKYVKKKKIESFYIYKSQASEWVEKQTVTLTQLAEEAQGNSQEIRQASTEALGMIHNLVDKLGFTPQIQELTKKIAYITIKVLGTKPHLSSILALLKKHEGEYLTTHSLMLADINIALALRLGWSSAPTFLKLTLASFLHDLPIQDNAIASLKNLEEANRVFSISSKEMFIFKQHPIQAAKYAQQFHDIPPDVDTILIQHHEMPDGSGFPRGLYHGHISPLSALFIVSHDILNYVLEFGTEGIVEKYIPSRSDLFSIGTFKKALHGLIQE